MASTPSTDDGLYAQDFKGWNALIRPILVWMDRRGITGNLVTLFRLPFVPVSYMLFDAGMILAGGIVWISGMALDGFDGPLARFQDWLYRQGIKLSAHLERQMSLCQRIMFKGSTYLGGILDAILDKILMAVPFITLGRDVLVSLFVEIWFVVAIALTILSVALWMLGIPKPGANWFGKYKIWIECGVVTTLGLPKFVNQVYGLLTHQTSPHNIVLGPVVPCVPNAILVVAIVFAALSFVTHARYAWTTYWTRSA